MKIKFVPKDIWVGLYLDRKIDWREAAHVTTTYYLCLVPCFPIIWITRKTVHLDIAKRRYCKPIGKVWAEKTYIEKLRGE